MNPQDSSRAVFQQQNTSSDTVRATLELYALLLFRDDAELLLRVPTLEDPPAGVVVVGRQCPGVTVSLESASRVPLRLNSPLPLTMGVVVLSQMDEESRGQNEEDRRDGESGDQGDPVVFS